MQNLANAGGCAMACCSCACAALPIVFLVYLGIYSFNNPDSDAWYGKTTEGTAALFKD